MAKDGPGAPRKLLRGQPKRTARKAAPLPKPNPQATSSKSARPHEPDPGVLAKEERARADFQLIFGQNLRAARLKSGLKQSDVAAKTGLTQQHLSLIEAGRQNITLKTMILLAEVVDHDVANMLRKATDTLKE